MKVNVLIDSSIWIEFFINGNKAEKAAAIIKKLNKNNCKIPSIVLYEVYKKLKKQINEQAGSQAIAYIIDISEIVYLNERLAIMAAEASLENSLSMADAIIMATAEAKNAEIKTMDSHFSSIKRAEII